MNFEEFVDLMAEVITYQNSLPDGEWQRWKKRILSRNRSQPGDFSVKTVELIENYAGFMARSKEEAIE